MYDTHVTVVGNALHEPELRKTANTGALVTTFKIASTARRLSRETGKWVDGNSLRVRVTCWRALAGNVKESVTRGDPLVVMGRLFTRDWTDEDGVKRTQYELEATAVGHDLSRGRAVFERRKANTATSAVEDAEAAQRVGGELTEVVPEHEAPAQFNDVPFEVVHDQGIEVPAAIGALRGGGFTADPVDTAAPGTGPLGTAAPGTGPPGTGSPGAGSPGAGALVGEVVNEVAGAEALAPVIDEEPDDAEPDDTEPDDTGPDDTEPDGSDPLGPDGSGELVEAVPGAPPEQGSGRRRGLRRSKVPA